MIYMDISRVMRNQYFRLAVLDGRFDESDDCVMIFIFESHAPKITDIGLLHTQDSMTGCNTFLQVVIPRRTPVTEQTDIHFIAMLGCLVMVAPAPRASSSGCAATIKYLIPAPPSHRHAAEAVRLASR